MNMDDDRLIERTLGDDPEAFGELVRRHADAVHGLVLRACGDADMAGELAQETFCKAFAALPGFERGRPLRPWLLAVALNTARSALRAERREAVHLDRRDPEAARDAGDPSDGPEDLAGAGQRRDRLGAMVRRLPDKLRDAVALRFWADLPFAEVAEALGVSESAAKMRVYRALEQLRVLLGDEDHT